MAKFNITANAIAPGFTSTEMVDAIPEEIAAQIKAKIPLGRFATAEENCQAAAFLAADGDYITGQEFETSTADTTCERGLIFTWKRCSQPSMCGQVNLLASAARHDSDVTTSDAE